MSQVETLSTMPCVSIVDPEAAMPVLGRREPTLAGLLRSGRLVKGINELVERPSAEELRMRA
jgi:hypothetical protein